MSRASRSGRIGWVVLSALLGAVLLAASAAAPAFVSTPQLDRTFLGPLVHPPFGTDDRGIALLEYALQGASIVTLPALASSALVAVLATVAGLVRCLDLRWIDSALQAVAEIVGSLPRLVVVLVVALILPREWKGLLPIGLAWAVLAAPGAMDEAAATAGRLGGSRFVEALRAHGFSGARIYLYHVVWLNLRPVVARQAAEVLMQVVFLEIALSYLALRRNAPSFTHSDAQYSWAILLYQGYTALLGVPLLHSLLTGLLLVAIVAALAQALRLAGRAR
jgi:ABC-type dipeptide/oligopeptide/nickel transport system permease subunit